MKNPLSRQSQLRRKAAFTLIELIVVIAIIAILAALIIPITGALDKKKKIGVAQTQLKALELAIDGYKTKLGFFPPDNPNNVVTNQLYFELLGTTNGNFFYRTLDGSAEIANTSSSAGDINNFFGVQGFANSSTRAHTDDQGASATPFIDHLTPNQIGVIDPANKPLIKILICAVEWPSDKTPGRISGTQLNPWCYNSSHPTNNVNGYDLWVDIIIKGKTNRVCNWSKDPVQL